MENNRAIGQVLAANDEGNLLYIDATTQIKGKTTFADDLIAPNIVYAVTGGNGITVTSGQTCTIIAGSAPTGKTPPAQPALRSKTAQLFNFWKQKP